MKQVIKGNGEIGRALQAILNCDATDKTDSDSHYDILHICFPYTEDFEKEVKRYQELTTPDITIIHSTVPVGTSDRLGAVHSPVRGVHPNLEEGIRTFVKFFGGERSNEAAKIFEDKGIRVFCTPEARDTEALKLWDTSQYGALILLMREIYDWCKDNEVDFDVVYTLANETYNEGYLKLGRPEVVRPYLKYMEGKIGGHCVVPNSKLFNSKTAQQLRDK